MLLSVIASSRRRFVGLLDLYPGAAAAYSLRALSASFLNQPIIRVRRSSDNAESDFTAAQITDGALTTWTGAGNGFVRTWYDQSGNNRHAQQATAGNQPQIVSGGELIAQNGVIAIRNSGGVAQFLNLSERVAAGSTATVFSVYAATINNSFIAADQTTGSVSVFGRRITGTYIIRGTNTVLDGGTHASTMGVHTGLFAGASSVIRRNGSVVASGTTDNVLGFNQIMNFAGISASEIFGTEIVIYPSNQSANFAGVEGNQNTAWEVY